MDPWEGMRSGSIEVFIEQLCYTTTVLFAIVTNKVKKRMLFNKTKQYNIHIFVKNNILCAINIV